MARITRVRISGYRSVNERVELVFPRNKPVVLLGENNAGKSNIVKALRLVLGSFWPGNHDPEDHEFFDRARDRPINIDIEFDGAEAFGDKYVELVWHYDGLADEPVLFRGRPGPYGHQYGYVSNDDRDTCMCIVVEAERNLGFHLGYSSKWTLLSRLMRRFHKALISSPTIKTDLETLFEQVKGKFQEVPEFSTFVEELDSQLRDLVASMSHQLEVSFEAYNPVEFFQALRLQATERGLIRTLDEMGTGEQQVLAVAFARAYAEAFHSGVLLIVEEPEAHLHPLAQTWLAQRLRSQAAAGLQIVLTTHSPDFVDVESLEGMALVRKIDGATRITQLTTDELVKYSVEHGAPADRVTINTILPFYAANETTEIKGGFFAKEIVLVEGPTESMALPVYLARCGLEIYKEGIAVISVDGKGNLAKWRRFFEAFGTPCYTIFDNDSEDDADGNKRRDALKSMGLGEVEAARLSQLPDWIVEAEYAVFGTDFESVLREHIPDYRRLEEEARNYGIGSKPLIARWVAERLQRDENIQGWMRLYELTEAIRRKLTPALGDPAAH